MPGLRKPSDMLTTPEINALIELTTYHWSPIDRARVAAALPQVYAKLAGVQVDLTVVPGDGRECTPIVTMQAVQVQK